MVFFLFDRGVLAFFFSPPVLLLFFDLLGRVSGTTIDDDLSSLVDALNIENNVYRCVKKKKEFVYLFDGGTFEEGAGGIKGNG